MSSEQSWGESIRNSLAAAFTPRRRGTEGRGPLGPSDLLEAVHPSLVAAAGGTIGGTGGNNGNGGGVRGGGFPNGENGSGTTITPATVGGFMGGGGSSSGIGVGGGGGNESTFSPPTPALTGVLRATQKDHGNYESSKTLAELSMQSEENKDTFLDTILHSQDVVILIMMKPGSSRIHHVVCPTKYLVHGGVSSMMGRVISFVGNTKLFPVMMPAQAGWQWKEVKIKPGTEALNEYGQDPTTLSETAGSINVTVPRVLLVPVAMASLIIGKELSPMDL